MTTAIAMVTIGKDKWTRVISVARARRYAAKHGYEFLQIKEPSIPTGERTPHWEKLLIPQRYPDFDRYLVIDDDILINDRVAPPLPHLPEGMLGIVKEPVPGPFPPPVEWLGNSGVLFIDRKGMDIFSEAYRVGELKEIVPGFGDQPAINRVAWQQQRVSELDWRWNYIAMADWLRSAHGQEYPWTNNLALARLAKATLFLRLAWEALLQRLGFGSAKSNPGPVGRLYQSYFVHLIAFRMGAGLVHRLLR
jgi:hypothetical protein